MRSGASTPSSTSTDRGVRQDRVERSERLVRLRAHLRVIDGDVARVVDAYRPNIECRRGCSDCCSQTFRVSAVEGDLLREGLATLEPTQHDAVLERARSYRADTRTPCPALDAGGGCMLYDWRPRICRKYGIPLWHPDRPNEVTTCEKNFRGVADIDAGLILDPQAAWASEWIAMREAIGQAHGDVATIAEHLVQPTRP